MVEIHADNMQRTLDEIARNSAGTLSLLSRQSRDGGTSDLTPRLRILIDGVKNIGGGLNKFSASAERATSGMGRLHRSTGGAADALTNFASRMKVGFIVAPLVRAFSEAADTYRDMAAVGQNFKGSIVQMRMAAAASGQSLSDFAKMFNEKSSAVAASMGGRQMGILASKVRESTEAMGMFAYGTQELNDFTIEYLETQRLNQNLERYNQTQHVDAITQLAETTNGYAAMFGKSRQKTMADFVTASKDVSLLARNMSQARLSLHQQRALDSRTNFLSSLPGEASKLGEWLTRSVGSRGTFNHEMNQTFAMVPQVAARMGQMAAAVERGQEMSLDEELAHIEGIKQAIANASPQLNIAAANGDQNAAQIIRTGAELSKLGRKELEERRREAKEKEAITKITLVFNNLWKRITGKFLEGFLQPLAAIETAFSGGKFDTMVLGFMEEVGNLGTLFGEFMKSTFTVTNVRDWVRTITNVMRDGVTYIGGWIKWAGDWLTDPQKRIALESGIATWFNETWIWVKDFSGRVKTIFEGLYEALAPIANFAIKYPWLAAAAVLFGPSLIMSAARAILGMIAGGAGKLLGKIIPGAIATTLGLAAAPTGPAAARAGASLAAGAAGAAGATGAAGAGAAGAAAASGRALALRTAAGAARATPAAALFEAWTAYDKYKEATDKHQKGETDIATYRRELGEIIARFGVRTVTTALGAGIGTAVTPGVGSVIGGIAGYTAGSVVSVDALVDQLVKLSGGVGGAANPLLQDAIREQQAHIDRLTRNANFLNEVITTAPRAGMTAAERQADLEHRRNDIAEQRRMREELQQARIIMAEMKLEAEKEREAQRQIANEQRVRDEEQRTRERLLQRTIEEWQGAR